MPLPRTCRLGRGRSIGVAERRRTVLSRGRVLMVALIVALVAAPAAAGAQSTEDRIAHTRAAIDAAAQSWFESQSRAEKLDTEISDLERTVDESQANADRTAVVARARAVEIYMGSGTDFGPVFESSDALDSVRRAELLDRANAESQRAIDEFEIASERLTEQRAELEQRRDDQQEVVDRLAAEQASLEEQLSGLQAQAQREQAIAAAQAQRSAASAEKAAPARSATAAPAKKSPAPTRPAAVPPPPAPAGTHPHHDDPFLVCTRARESRGNYSVVSASGLYHGAYQFAPTTWNATASHEGRLALVGVLPSRASVYDQDDMAWTLYQWQGKVPWGGRC